MATSTRRRQPLAPALHPERYERRVKLVFKRNPDYYIKGLPYVDGIEWQITPDAAARVALLRSGRWILCLPRGCWRGRGVPLQKTNPELKGVRTRT